MARVLAIATALAALAVGAVPAAARDVLPDLDQEPPDGLHVSLDNSGPAPIFRFGFHSATDNVGAGPLIIDGHRAGTSEPTMVADQIVQQSDGSTRTVPAVGTLRYVYESDHQHWHYLGFQRFELRRTSDYALVVPDQKTGFCLGDRLDSDPNSMLPGEPPHPVYTSSCGLRHPELLSVEEGISVGYLDIYYANFEGQFVDVRGVPAGEYYLVHRVNADRKLVESDYSNDAASVLVSLTWPNGTDQLPAIKLLRTCAGSDWCPGADQQPPPLTERAAVTHAVTALRRSFNARSPDVTCTAAKGDFRRICRAAWRSGSVRYRASVDVTNVRTREGLRQFTWTIRAAHGATKLRPRTGSARLR
jgi:hypothetical protein